MPLFDVQFALLISTSLLFAAAFALGLRHIRRAMHAGAATGDGGAMLPHEASMGRTAHRTVLAGTALGVGLLLWRAISLHNMLLTFSNPFDAFLTFATLLALTLLYLCWTRHLRGLAFFLLPMIVSLLVIGLVLAALHPHPGSADYVPGIWGLVHLITIRAATVCLALACVSGVVYLLADRQLRRKGLSATHRWVGLPPLGAMEKFTQWMIYGGFPLLSISTLAGILVLEHSQANAPAASATQNTKIVFGILSWLVYAVAIHVPFNPSFRGRRAAWLSVAGFILFIGAFVAAKWS
jgi:ABC-type uncharacterized transport system permease subunit